MMYALPFWAATLIGLSRGYFRPPAGLSSLRCMLYVMFCLCIWGAQLCLCHDSSQAFASFDLFLFFSTAFATKAAPPKARPRTSTYTEGIQIWKPQSAMP